MGTAKENFRRNLARLLREKDMTARDLAVALDLSDSTISGWLKGRIAPELGRLDVIAAALGVSHQTLTANVDETVNDVPARDLETILRELARSRGFDLVPRKK